MTNEEQKLREFAERWGMGYFDDGVDYGYKPTQVKIEQCLSDLTVLISENYVEKAKYDEAVRQRDELREALRDAIGIIRTWHGMGVIDEVKEADMWRIYSSHAPEMKKLIAAIKNTDG